MTLPDTRHKLKDREQNKEHDHAPNEKWDDEHYPAEYDAENREFFGRDYAKVQRMLVDILRVKAGKTVADVGAGTGFVTETLIAHGMKVIAVDSSEHMLGYLDNKFGGRKLLQCVNGNAEKLPLEDEVVDAAVASVVMHHLEFPSRCVGEMKRIVKPGGSVVILEMAPPQEAYSHEGGKHSPHELLEQSVVLELLRKASLLDIGCESVGNYLFAPDDVFTEVYVAFGRRPN